MCTTSPGVEPADVLFFHYCCSFPEKLDFGRPNPPSPETYLLLMAGLRDTLSLSLMGACLIGTIVGVQLLGSAKKASRRPPDLSVEERIKQLKLN